MKLSAKEIQAEQQLQADIESLPRWDDKNPLELKSLIALSWEESYTAYEQYCNAMGRRRDYFLDENSFVSLFHYEKEYGGVFKFKDSYVHGFLNEDMFCVSHFAPASMREGIAMIKELKKYDNIVFAVTEDLGGMLEKLEYRYQGARDMVFACERVEKHIFTSFDVEEDLEL